MTEPHSARPPHAVVDIGSNSVRLVVYDGLDRAPFPRFNEKSLCRLGAGLAETGELSADGFRRTLAALRRFAAVAGAMDVPGIDVIATEAVRRASNGGALVAAIERETGLAVRIISGAEEARYAALGVIAGFYRPAGVVGDMGGGSLEVATIAEGRVGEGSASMPLGALPVQALLTQSSVEARRRVDALLAESLPPDFRRATFYAIGGGWRAFARAHMLSVDAPVRVAHGYALDASVAREFAKTLWRPAVGRSPEGR
ncbi:MAG: exopolyphosphatase, partial [Candidatus Eremiobacteraeota bacterium]|nr:exopolyphosphatase [Candidatus Eremiobacteraeota bacterium]